MLAPRRWALPSSRSPPLFAAEKGRGRTAGPRRMPKSSAAASAGHARGRRSALGTGRGGRECGDFSSPPLSSSSSLAASFSGAPPWPLPPPPPPARDRSASAPAAPGPPPPPPRPRGSARRLAAPRPRPAAPRPPRAGGGAWRCGAAAATAAGRAQRCCHIHVTAPPRAPARGPQGARQARRRRQRRKLRGALRVRQRNGRREGPGAAPAPDGRSALLRGRRRPYGGALRIHRGYRLGISERLIVYLSRRHSLEVGLQSPRCWSGGGLRGTDRSGPGCHSPSEGPTAFTDSKCRFLPHLVSNFLHAGFSSTLCTLIYGNSDVQIRKAPMQDLIRGERDPTVLKRNTSNAAPRPCSAPALTMGKPACEH